MSQEIQGMQVPLPSGLGSCPQPHCATATMKNITEGIWSKMKRKQLYKKLLKYKSTLVERNLNQTTLCLPGLVMSICCSRTSYTFWETGNRLVVINRAYSTSSTSVWLLSRTTFGNWNHAIPFIILTTYEPQSKLMFSIVSAILPTWGIRLGRDDCPQPRSDR